MLCRFKNLLAQFAVALSQSKNLIAQIVVALSQLISNCAICGWAFKFLAAKFVIVLFYFKKSLAEFA